MKLYSTIPRAPERAAGHLFRSPPWRALRPSRPPGLPPLEGPKPIPCHRGEQLPNKPVQGNGTPFGLGMLTRLRLPACPAVPARRAPNLPKGRHVFGDGGSHPSPGLLPAGHRPTPATPPPAGLISTFHGSDPRHTPGTPPMPATPPAYSTFKAANISEPPLARRPGAHAPSCPPSPPRAGAAEAEKKRSFWLEVDDAAAGNENCSTSPPTTGVPRRSG